MLWFISFKFVDGIVLEKTRIGKTKARVPRGIRKNSFFSSAGTSARLIQYSGGGNTSTASSLRGALDLVSLCFSGCASIVEYGGDGETSIVSAPRGARGRVSLCFSVTIFVLSNRGTCARIV
jgi:hypothetical protein